MNEHFASFALHQRSQALSHSPTDVPEDLQPIRPWNQKSDASVAQHADGFGKALESLEIEPGYIELLELFFRKHSALSSQHSAYRLVRLKAQTLCCEMDVPGLNAEC